MPYLNDWEKSGFVGMVGDFSDIYITKEEYEADVCPYKNEEYWLEKKLAMAAELEKDQWKGIEVLLASYCNENYEGDAFVLFKKDGVLYEVNGGHCSCYGLENQWEPEPTNIKSLRHRLESGNLGREYCSSENKFANELREVIQNIEG